MVVGDLVNSNDITSCFIVILGRHWGLTECPFILIGFYCNYDKVPVRGNDAIPVAILCIISGLLLGCTQRRHTFCGSGFRV